MTQESKTPESRSNETSALIEVLKVYGLVTAATFAVTRLRGVQPVSEYVHLAVGAFFLFGALHMAGRDASGRGVHRFGMSVGGLLGPAPDDKDPGPFGIYDLLRTARRSWKLALRESLIAVGVAALIFPFFAVGFAYWHGPEHPFVFNPPDDFASFAAAQIVVVGLPEEAFFRGFIQTRLDDFWAPRRIHVRLPFVRAIDLDVRAWLLQAFLFGLIHFVVDLNPARLAVFFPGLVFGLLRGWRGGIGAAIVFHALSNVYSEILVRGWL